MYAVIETGGKQYRVSPGQTVEVELAARRAGSDVALDRVLLVSTDEQDAGRQPAVAGARWSATIIREGRGEKIIVFKYKSKKRYRRTQGHRQDYTYLTITDIQADGKSLVPDDERERYETPGRQGRAAATSRVWVVRLSAARDEASATGGVARDEAAIDPRSSAASRPSAARARTRTRDSQ